MPAHIVRRSQATHALPSPPLVSRLPVELLSSIFMLSSEPNLKDVVPFDSSAIRTPLILSRVSKHWRNVARNTPRLWTRICVTPELLVENETENPLARVNVRHIIMCLGLSKKCPLEILIDARDINWDYSEPEIMPIDPDSSYDPYSAPALIFNSLALLLPHLRRWQSLTIFTDTWAPMFMALNFINPHLTSFGAPLLDTLTLMRCNDFVSFGPEFQPRHLAKPDFMRRRKRSNAEEPSEKDAITSILPKLKHLTLQGVHVDWESLANAVEESTVGGLSTLSLGSHSLQVMPSRNNFRRLLNASAGLETLKVSGSGPIPLSSSSSPVDDDDELKMVRLDKLQRLEVGYRSLEEAEATFGSILAPSVKEVALEDISHPADAEDVDGPGVLACLVEGDRTRALPLSDVEALTLRNVKLGETSAVPEALQGVLDGMTRLKELTVVDMELEKVLLALLPSGTSCPCPELEFLTMRAGPICRAALTEALHVRTEGYMEMVKLLIGGRQDTLPQTSEGLEEVEIDFEFSSGVVRKPEKAEALVGGTSVTVRMRSALSGLEGEGGPFEYRTLDMILRAVFGSGIRTYN